MAVVHSLRLLGLPRLTSQNTYVPLPAKQLGILVILSYQAPRPVTREFLSRLFWPKSSQTARNHSLSQAIYNIRRRCGAVLQSVESTVELRDLTCDLWALQNLMKSGAYDEAAQLIAGEFCEGLVIRGCVEFDQWLELSRAATREVVMQLLNEPVSNEIRESLTSAFSLHDSAIPAQIPAPGKHLVRNGGFVGRVAERVALEKPWATSKSGLVQSALVTGDPGIGKTALCDRVLRKAVLQGARALTAGGYEVQRNLAYGVVGQVLRDAHRAGLLDNIKPGWRRAISNLLPAVGPPELDDGGEDRSDEQQNHRIAGAVHHLISQAARANPIVIFIDDVHWADSISMSIIHYVAHCDPELPILLLLASRDGDLPFLREGRWSLAASVSLQGLAPSESRMLIQSLLSEDRAHVEVETLQQLSGGNPFLIHALAKRTATPDSGLPPTVKEYFRNELAHLSPNASLTGAALSAVKDPISAGDIAWLSGLSEALTDSSLGELITAGFVDIGHELGLFRLKHQILGEVFLDNLQPVASAKLHGRVGKLLRDRGSPVAVVATQMMIAGNDADTCEAAVEAAEASVRLHAYREAEHFFRIAIGSAATPHIELESRIALSAIFLLQGRSEEAEVFLDQFSKKEQLTEAESALLEAHVFIAKLSEVGPTSLAHKAFDRAVQLEHLLPHAVATKLYADIAGNAQHGLHVLFRKATKAALRSLQKMEISPDQIKLEVLISAFQTVNAFTPANLERLDELTRESAPWPAIFASCLSAGALVRVSQGLVAEAEHLFLQALQVCEQYGFLDQRLRILNNLGVCFLEQGRWEDAEQQFHAVVRAAGSVAPKEIPSALNNLLIVGYERGDLEETLHLGQKYLRERDLQTARLRIGIFGILGLAELELGHLSKAREYETAIRTSAGYDLSWSNDISYVEIFIARMSALYGSFEEAESRLRKKIDAFSSRDFYCTARMKVELIQHMAQRSPVNAAEESKNLRQVLAAANAVPLVERLDRTRFKGTNH